jgi:RimJ/RimL family protein N-acetyltransferase
MPIMGTSAGARLSAAAGYSLRSCFTSCVEIGWRLAAEHWGRGYATEAARAVRDYALGPLALPEVLALVRPANAASINVLQKIGMERVGTRSAYGAEHLVYGARRRPATAP